MEALVPFIRLDSKAFYIGAVVIEKRGLFLKGQARDEILRPFLDRLIGIEIDGFLVSPPLGRPAKAPRKKPATPLETQRVVNHWEPIVCAKTRARPSILRSPSTKTNA